MYYLILNNKLNMYTHQSTIKSKWFEIHNKTVHEAIDIYCNIPVVFVADIDEEALEKALDSIDQLYGVDKLNCKVCKSRIKVLIRYRNLIDFSS